MLTALGQMQKTYPLGTCEKEFRYSLHPRACSIPPSQIKMVASKRRDISLSRKLL